MDDLIPIVLFLTIGGTFALAFYFRYRTRQDVQHTVRTAIERGDPLSPEIIETLASSLTNPFADLRRGIISLALGVAVYLMGLLLDEANATGALTALSMIPILIGFAYLGLWFFIGRKYVIARCGHTVS